MILFEKFYLKGSLNEIELLKRPSILKEDIYII